MSGQERISERDGGRRRRRLGVDVPKVELGSRRLPEADDVLQRHRKAEVGDARSRKRRLGNDGVDRT